MLRIFTIFIIISCIYCLNNGLGRTPQLGFNTWNNWGCSINEADFINATNYIVSSGLAKLGYNYVNMDDCWAIDRDENGKIITDAKKFPRGIKYIADYVHSKGLKFGLYTDRGTLTCQKRPGSKGYEQIDANTYAKWGVDYLKEDSCFASTDHQTAFSEYGLMRDALNNTGRQIFFSLCGWRSWYAPMGDVLGNSWRIASDCQNWHSLMNAVNVNSKLGKYAGPGHWNDPDMLIGSVPGDHFKLSPIRSRTMFSLWSIMAAPLLIGGKIPLSSFDHETVSNAEVIAVNQDLLGVQGYRVRGNNLTLSDPDSYNIWFKPLQNDKFSMLFLNNNNNSRVVTCDQTCWKNMNIASGNSYEVRDLWRHVSIGHITSNLPFSIENIPINGGSFIGLFTKVRGYTGEFINQYSMSD